MSPAVPQPIWFLLVVDKRMEAAKLLPSFLMLCPVPTGESRRRREVELDDDDEEVVVVTWYKGAGDVVGVSAWAAVDIFECCEMSLERSGSIELHLLGDGKHVSFACSCCSDFAVVIEVVVDNLHLTSDVVVVFYVWEWLWWLWWLPTTFLLGLAIFRGEIPVVDADIDVYVAVAHACCCSCNYMVVAARQWDPV